MKKILSITLVILLSIGSIVMPTSEVVFAENTTSHNGNNIDIFQVINEVTIEEAIQLLPGTIIYGESDTESEYVSVQFADSYVQISKQDLSLLEESQLELPTYVDVSTTENELQQLSNGDSLYSSISRDTDSINIIRDLEYPLYKDGVIVIGNASFYTHHTDGDSINTESIIIEENSMNDDEIDESIIDNESIDADKTSNEEDITKVEEEQSEVSKADSPTVEENSIVNKLDEPSNNFKTFAVSVENVGFSASDKYFKTLEDTPIYDNSSGRLVEVGMLKKGEIYPRYESSPKWHLVQFGNRKLFVKKENTIPASGKILKNINDSYQIKKETFTAQQNVTVYDNTSGKLVPFAVLNKGQEYQISNDYGGEWIIVVLADRVGYVRTTEIKKNYFPEFGDYFVADKDDIPVYDNRSGKLVEVGQLEKGQSYPRYEGSPKWHKIQFGDFQAFVRKDDTSPSNGRTIKNLNNNKYKIQNKTVTANKDINVYDNSGGLVPFATIKAGQKYSIAHDYGGTWIYVVFADRIGFIKTSEVTKNYYPEFGGYFKVVDESIPVYDNRSGKLEIVGELKKGQSYKRYEGSPQWHQIQFGDYKAYVHKEGTQPTSGNDIKNKNDGKYKSSKSELITNKDIAVYDNSNGKLVPFGTIKTGQIYPIAHDYGGDWIYVIFADRIGYVRSVDVEIYGVNKTNYDYSFSQMVNAQMKGTPKSDGAGLIPATRGEVEFYSNPLNFQPNTQGYLQFLVLSRPLGLNAKEVNEKILNNKGNLTGMAQAFIDAGRQYSINEAYLIAHALHETGNGKSALASGIPVDKYGKVTRDSDGNIVENSKTAHIVYNMYGYGANDSCPIDCGAKYAFDRGWFTLSESIIGGASSIYNYINRGQDTLYKMRWNPINPGYPQYATHVQWAVLQTSRIAEIYNLLNNYTLFVDIPVFNNMPEYGKNLFAITDTANSTLNFRSGPGTSYGRVGSIPDGSRIEVLDSHPDGWYQIRFDGQTGWASAAYINLEY